MTLRASWIVATTRGRLLTHDPEAVAGGNLSVDTRLLEPGDVFLALPGEHVDGGHYIEAALARGAAGVIATPERLRDTERRTAIAVAVEDPRATLDALAHGRRAQLDGHAIGVTGAAGKTTTTDVIAAMLRPLMSTHATRHGFNTDQGVAATIAGAPQDTRALVVELGMRGRGEIASKAAMLRPTAGLITNIGPEHLELVGTVADVARNKAELLEALAPGALCVVPADEPLLDEHLRSDLRTLRHGPGGEVFLRSFADGVAEIACPGETVRLRPGFDQPHNLANLVAATALVWGLGLRPPEDLRVRLSPLRWQIEHFGEVELVFDCAKTSPLALRHALDAFVAEPSSGRRMLVLGELPDLGPRAQRYHRQAGEHAQRVGIDVLIAVGRPAEAYFAGFRGERRSVSSPAAARRLVQAIGQAGDRVLVKGPRRVALERMLAA